jgi:pilus assembly protein Flp/PilA
MNQKEVIVMLFAPKEKAQGLVEYALILVLVAVVVIVILALLGPAIGKIFSNIVAGL